MARAGSLAMASMMAATAATASFAVIAPTSALAMPSSAPAKSTPAPAKTYHIEIVNYASGLRADVWKGSTVPFQGVVLWPDNRNTSQEFDLIPIAGSVFFHIKARHSGQCLMPDWRDGWGGNNGAKIIQYSCDDPNYKSSQWRILPISHPSNCDDNALCATPFTTYQFVIANRSSNRCLDVSNPSTLKPAVRAPLQLWDCISYDTYWNAKNQIWRLHDVDTNRYAYRANRDGSFIWK
jgi:hypothetical protein